MTSTTSHTYRALGHASLATSLQFVIVAEDLGTEPPTSASPEGQPRPGASCPQRSSCLSLQPSSMEPGKHTHLPLNLLFPTESTFPLPQSSLWLFSVTTIHHVERWLHELAPSLVTGSVAAFMVLLLQTALSGDALGLTHGDTLGVIERHRDT